jgi:hypothetical protein
MASITSTTISSRFAGPPFAVNGGYAAGILAERANLRAAHVQLKAPVPLETPIQIRADNPGASIVHNGRTLITASPATLLDRTHPAVDFVSAALAAGGTDPSSHPFPSCFVCGPDRASDDGMHLFPGPVAEDTVAVSWRPSPWQADPTGTLPVRMVTSALDCPSAFPMLRPGGAALLASMTFQINRLPRVGEHLIVTGWSRGVDGRKMHAASAIASAEGETLARANTLWIEVGASDLARLAESTIRSAA